MRLSIITKKRYLFISQVHLFHYLKSPACRFSSCHDSSFHSLAMKTFTLAGLMATMPAAMAAPAWTMYAWNESLPEIHGKPINANSGSFFINRPTTAVCPSYDLDCPSKNTTIISGPVYGNGANGLPDNATTYWFMGILEEGGQNVGVKGFESGAGGLFVEYAAAESDNYSDEFRSSHGVLVLDNSTMATIGKPVIRETAPSYYADGPLGWSACSWDNGTTYRIKSGPQVGHNPLAGCLNIQIALEMTTAPAPQFYYCEGCEFRCDQISNSACSGPSCVPPYCGPHEDRSTYLSLQSS